VISGEDVGPAMPFGQGLVAARRTTADLVGDRTSDSKPRLLTATAERRQRFTATLIRFDVSA